MYDEMGQNEQLKLTVEIAIESIQHWKVNKLLEKFSQNHCIFYVTKELNNEIRVKLRFSSSSSFTELIRRLGRMKCDYKILSTKNTGDDNELQ